MRENSRFFADYYNFKFRKKQKQTEWKKLHLINYRFPMN